MIQAIRKTSAVDEVFEAIQRQIASGELPLVHRFPPQEVMAGQYGVSRSTIREAINKLTLLGFLAAKPGVGTTVVGDGSDSIASALGRHIFLKSDEVSQFMEARLYLEKAAVRLAILKADETDFKVLEELIARQEDTCRRGDFAAFSELDASFHRRIIESANNQLLLQFLDLIWDGLSQFIREVTLLQSAVENAIHFHHIMISHLKTRNLAKAEGALVEHLKDVALNIERNIGRDIGLAAVFQQEMEHGPKRRKA